MSKNIKQATKQEFIQGTDHFQEIFSKQTRWHQHWTRRDPFYFVEGGAMDFSLITTQIGSYWKCAQNKYVLKIYPMLVRKYMTSTVHEHVPDNKKKIVSVCSRANMHFSISWNLQLEPAIWLNTSKAETLNKQSIMMTFNHNFKWCNRKGAMKTADIPEIVAKDDVFNNFTMNEP